MDVHELGEAGLKDIFGGHKNKAKKTEMALNLYSSKFGVDSTDEKVLGKRLQEIARNATTGGLYTQVGVLYGFPIKVVSERTLKEGLEFTDNRFAVFFLGEMGIMLRDPRACGELIMEAED